MTRCLAVSFPERRAAPAPTHRHPKGRVETFPTITYVDMLGFFSFKILNIIIFN
jgi:hypothetical protein